MTSTGTEHASRKENVSFEERETQINLCAFLKSLAFAVFFLLFLCFYFIIIGDTKTKLFLCASLVVFNSVIRFIGFCAFYFYTHFSWMRLLIQYESGNSDTELQWIWLCILVYASLICVRVLFYVHYIDWPLRTGCLWNRTYQQFDADEYLLFTCTRRSAMTVNTAE